jgi:hypothetical protein
MPGPGFAAPRSASPMTRRRVLQSGNPAIRVGEPSPTMPHRHGNSDRQPGKRACLDGFACGCPTAGSRSSTRGKPGERSFPHGQGSAVLPIETPALPTARPGSLSAFSSSFVSFGPTALPRSRSEAGLSKETQKTKRLTLETGRGGRVWEWRQHTSPPTPGSSPFNHPGE